MTEQHVPDHDLLIRVDAKVDGLIKSVDSLTGDHEQRIRTLESWVWKSIGGLAILNAGVFIYSIFR